MNRVFGSSRRSFRSGMAATAALSLFNVLDAPYQMMDMWKVTPARVVVMVA